MVHCKQAKSKLSWTWQSTNLIWHEKSTSPLYHFIFLLLRQLYFHKTECKYICSMHPNIIRRKVLINCLCLCPSISRGTNFISYRAKLLSVHPSSRTSDYIVTTVKETKTKKGKKKKKTDIWKISKYDVILCPCYYYFMHLHIKRNN